MLAVDARGDVATLRLEPLGRKPRAPEALDTGWTAVAGRIVRCDQPVEVHEIGRRLRRLAVARLLEDPDPVEFPGLADAVAVELDESDDSVVKRLEDTRRHLATLEWLLVEDREDLPDSIRARLAGSWRVEADWSRPGTAGGRRRRGILVVDTQRHSSSVHVKPVDSQEAQPVALVGRLAPRPGSTQPPDSAGSA